MAGGLSPRVVVAVRPTEWDQLLARHATPGQVRFFLESRGRDVAAVIDRHRAQEAAVTAVERAIPTAWRRTQIRRADFPAFLFTPEDIGLERATPAALTGGSAQENAACIREIMAGAPGPCSDAVLINAAFVALLADRVASPAEGLALARETIESGRARELLAALAAKSQALAK